MSQKTEVGSQKSENPGFEELVSKALAALQRGEFAAARDHVRAYAAGHTREAQHYLIEGLATLAMADWTEAHNLFRAATEAFPDNAQMWFNRALAEENLHQLQESEASYQRSLQLKPDQGEIFGNLSNIYRKTRHFPEAVQMACRALAFGVPKAYALNILGLALGKQGNFTEAQKAFDEAIGITAGDGAIYANRANLAIDQLKFDEAWPFFAAARELDDNSVIVRDEGMARLLAGDYAKGLPLYEVRLKLPDALRLRPECPRWNGENLAGKKLLLISEQGYGDTIQFSRYANKLAEQGADLIWIVRQPLQRLLADNLPGRVLIETDLIPETDFWLPILSLPFALGMTKPQPAPAVFRAANSPRLPDAPGKQKIGIVWQGSPTHERDHERSIPLELLEPALKKIDAQFYAPIKSTDGNQLRYSRESGNPDASKSEHTTLGPRRRAALYPRLRGNDENKIIALAPLIKDFADTAALLKQLDCLITVDTAVAHLAGALDVPTYLLLPYCPDWRWGTQGETTPWYKSLTLLRQPHYGNWESVVQQLLEKLP